MKKTIVNNPENINGIKVVNDYEEILKCLLNGEEVMHYEWGNSLYPIIMNGEYCKISPREKHHIAAGQPVFCSFLYRDKEDGQLKTAYMVHRCTEVFVRDGEYYFKIEGTDGTVFGWTKDVYGVAERTNVFQDESALWS